MGGTYVAPRWRLPLALFVACLFFGGCAARVQQDTGEDGTSLVPVPFVKVPLLKVPLTNRRVSNDLLEDILPEPDQLPTTSRW